MTSFQNGILAHDSQARALWEKLRGLTFDRGDGSNTFASRLAREQGWSVAFTGRVIEEYRRFLLLFALERRKEKTTRASPGEPPAVRIVPSATVDKAWHLHLLYTQSYWETLCRDILGEPLHHQPASGSSDEAGTLDAVYHASMEAYRTTFGELAPSDIWPVAKGTPPPGTPLAEVLGSATPASRSSRLPLFLPAGILALLLLIPLLKWGTLNIDSVMGALAVACGLLIAVCACAALFVGAIRSAERTSRRSVGRDGGEVFFCGGSGDSSGHDSHSHGGHSDSGGGHSCSGHGCGGHGCGGH